MSPLDELLNELDQWNFAGEEATLWWRDDDAALPHDRLVRLLESLQRWDVPPALAVIPGTAGTELASMLADRGALDILQHGIAHTNRAGPDAKKQELVDCQDWDWSGDLLGARQRLVELFPDALLPVLVPPWNRIDAEIARNLDRLGFLGLSCFGPRSTPHIGESVWVVNTHVDLVNWRDGRRFAGEREIVDQMTRHLRARRKGEADAAEPTGILSHHLVHDEDCFTFVDEFLALLDEHPAVTWLSAQRVFQTRWR